MYKSEAKREQRVVFLAPTSVSPQTPVSERTHSTHRHDDIKYNRFSLSTCFLLGCGGVRFFCVWSVSENAWKSCVAEVETQLEPRERKLLNSPSFFASCLLSGATLVHKPRPEHSHPSARESFACIPRTLSRKVKKENSLIVSAFSSTPNTSGVWEGGKGPTRGVGNRMKFICLIFNFSFASPFSPLRVNVKTFSWSFGCFKF